MSNFPADSSLLCYISANETTEPKILNGTDVKALRTRASENYPLYNSCQIEKETATIKEGNFGFKYAAAAITTQCVIHTAVEKCVCRYFSNYNRASFCPRQM